MHVIHMCILLKTLISKGFTTKKPPYKVAFGGLAQDRTGI
jgi:hypothetical protein